MKKIGFVGVGSIGRPMALRLVDAGFDLVICDRDTEALTMFSQAGAATTGVVRDCVATEIIIFMVADDEQLERCIGGPDGLLSGLKAQPPRLLIVMSTVSPDTVRRIAKTVAPRAIRVIDAPVSGGPLAAAAGKLSVMVGGDGADLDYARPVIEKFGSQINHCGALGTGSLTKIINNMVGVTTLMLLAEALQLAHRAGLDLAQLTAAMEISSGRNGSSADWQEAHDRYADYASSMPRIALLLRTCAKDMKLALQLGEKAGIGMPILQAAWATVAAMPPEEMHSRIQAFL